VKTKLNFIGTGFALALLLALNIQPSTAFAQGSLTPPDAPGPTMLTLSQIEPRTPISSLPFTISTPGSYYVTANLATTLNQNGIIVAADNVTIDLNGFTLFGGAGSSGEGVWAATARQNVVVRNGTVRNWPGSGINLYDSGSTLITLQNLHSISNGFTGIAVKNGSSVTDCLAVGNGVRGILVDNDCRVEHCKTSGNATLGIGAGANCQLLNNQSTGNGTGLSITGTSNLISGNIVMLNTANYSIVLGNQLDLLLCQVPETINWPAKVKLIGSMNVTSGSAITINANNVTIDLNGFTLSSTENPAASSNGILINGPAQNIAIANGFIQGGVTNNGSGVYSGSGFGYGILDGQVLSANVCVRNVSVSGCRNYGIYLPINSTVVESCTVRTAGNYGIVADIIKNSTAVDCGNNAIDGIEVSDCHGQTSVNGYGIFAFTALNCYGVAGSGGEGISATCAQNCYGYGFSGLSASTVENCYGYGTGGPGISATSLAQNCYAFSGGSPGLNATVAQNCYGFSSAGTGIVAFIASACHGDTISGTPLSVTHNINSF
jgi:hypothetical protein